MSRIKASVLKWKHQREAQGKHTLEGKTGLKGGPEFRRRAAGLMKAGFSKESANAMVGRQFWTKVKEQYAASHKRLKRREQ